MNNFVSDSQVDKRQVGVLALQGGVVEHLAMLTSLGAQAIPVRRAQHLDGLDALVLPGGESSTMDRLLRIFELRDPLVAAIRGGLPTLATCAGLVLLARHITDPAPGQQSLEILDITVQRNAFGPQVDSEETDVELAGPAGPEIVRAAFIRAPVVTGLGPGVTPIGNHRGQVVAVTSGAITGISFHPELTGDTTLHRRLIAQAAPTAIAS